jgi:hypothetical protein
MNLADRKGSSGRENPTIHFDGHRAPLSRFYLRAGATRFQSIAPSTARSDCLGWQARPAACRPYTRRGFFSLLALVKRRDAPWLRVFCGANIPVRASVSAPSAVAAPPPALSGEDCPRLELPSRAIPHPVAMPCGHPSPPHRSHAGLASSAFHCRT